jgi:hypothetical protein
MKIWTREQWIAAGTPKQRRATARTSSLAWILEYQPKILLPGKGQIPFEPWPFQQEFLQCRERFRAINKPRQCGISTTGAAEAAWEFDNVPGAQIVIISKDKDAAVNFHTYVRNILWSVRENNPNAPKIIKDNERVTTNSLGNKISSLAASKESGRSFSATHLYFDELAFVQYAEEIWQAASATLAQTGGRVTAISTPKGRANLFARIFESRDHMGFKTFSYAWWDVPTYNPYYEQYVAATGAVERKQWIEKAKLGDWYRGERPKYTDLAWRQEFEGAFDANVGTVFSTRELEQAFHRNWLQEVEDPNGIITEHWTAPELPADCAPVVGCDLGRKNDATVLITYDSSVYPAKVVDFKYIEAGGEWRDIIKVLREHYEKWDPVAAFHDGTGVGDVATTEIEEWSEPFFFTKDKKQNIIEGVQHAFGKPAVRMPKIPVLFDEHRKYVWDDLHVAQDTVMANALAIHAIDETTGLILGFDPSVNYVGSAQNVS